MSNFKISETETVFELEIDSTKKRSWQIGLMVQSGIYIIGSIISILVIVNDKKVLSLILGATIIFVFLYLLKNCIQNIQWIQKGKENLKIDKSKGTFHYKKMHPKEFDLLKGDLEDLSNLILCPENTEYIDSHPRYGLAGGKICLWIGEKRHRIGISLTIEEAKLCSLKINTFLKK